MKETIGLSLVTAEVVWEKSQQHLIDMLVVCGVIGFVLWLVFVVMLALGWTTGVCLT